MDKIVGFWFSLLYMNGKIPTFAHPFTEVAHGFITAGALVEWNDGPVAQLDRASAF